MLGVLAGSSLAQSSSDGDHAQRLKFEIWQRGLPECGAHGCSAANSAADLSALQLRWMYTRSMPIAALRGGSDGCAGTACEPDAVDLDQLRASMARLVVLAAAELATTARACASRLSPTALWAPEQSLRRLAPAVQPRGHRVSTIHPPGGRSSVPSLARRWSATYATTRRTARPRASTSTVACPAPALRRCPPSARTPTRWARYVLTTNYYLATTRCLLLAANSSLLTPHSSLLTPHSSLLTPHSSLPTRCPRRTLRRRSSSRST